MWVSFILPGREGWWFHLVVSTQPPWAALGHKLGTASGGITSTHQFSRPHRSIKYLRDKLSVCTGQSVHLFTCWMLIFIASQNPASVIFSLNHKGSSQEPLPIYPFATMTGFLLRMVGKFCVQDGICGSFCGLVVFFKQLLSSMAKEQVLPGSDCSSSWEKIGFCCWGLWCTLKKAAFIHWPCSPISTGAWGPSPCFTDFYLPTDRDSPQ